MLQLNRIYKNSNSEEIRIDTISLVRKRNRVVKAGLMTTAAADVFQREVKVLKLYVSANRTVSEIEVIGDFDTIEASSGNFTSAEWASPSARLDMSDLPIVGSTV